LIYTFLVSLQSGAPWSRWSIIKGYPTTDNFELTSLLVFVMIPKYVPGTSIKHQGGQSDLGSWVMRLGVWDSRLAGGQQEADIACSQLLYTFRDSTIWSDATFNITLDKAYTGTTIINQGVSVQQIDGPYEIVKNVDTNEFRYEFDLYLRG
jgi:hypothetical protein